MLVNYASKKNSLKYASNGGLEIRAAAVNAKLPEEASQPCGPQQYILCVLDVAHTRHISLDKVQSARGQCAHNAYQSTVRRERAGRASSTYFDSRSQGAFCWPRSCHVRACSLAFVVHRCQLRSACQSVSPRVKRCQIGEADEAGWSGSELSGEKNLLRVLSQFT